MNENIENKVDKYWSEHWSECDSKNASARDGWWKSPHIVRHVNKTICGEELEGWNAGPMKLLRQALSPDNTVEEALSVGCGLAHKEMDLLQEGLVQHFTCFDLSEEAIKIAKKHAEEKGLSDRILLLKEDFFASEYANKKYDMVFWDNSLHHMMNAVYAIEKSYDVLNKGGIFFCHDYVGKSRFQFSDMEMAIINGVRIMLPDPLFAGMERGTVIPKYIPRPKLEYMMMVDPSEAADSESILPGIAKVFPEALVIPTGGLIYFKGLEGILRNIEDDSVLLEYLLSLDDEAIRMGLTLYAFALAVK